jgi:hypothetical protein
LTAGLRYREIADVLHRPIGTVKSTLSRVGKEIEKLLHRATGTPASTTKAASKTVDAPGLADVPPDTATPEAKADTADEAARDAPALMFFI